MCSTAFSLNFINWIFWILNGQLFPGSSCLFQIIRKILSWRWPLGTVMDLPPPILSLSVCIWSIGSDQIVLRVGGVSLIYDLLSVPQTQQCVTLFTLNYSIIHTFVVLSRTVYFPSRSFSSSLNSLHPPPPPTPPPGFYSTVNTSPPDRGNSDGNSSDGNNDPNATLWFCCIFLISTQRRAAYGIGHRCSIFQALRLFNV